MRLAGVEGRKAVEETFQLMLLLGISAVVERGGYSWEVNRPSWTRIAAKISTILSNDASRWTGNGIGIRGNGWRRTTSGTGRSLGTALR